MITATIGGDIFDIRDVIERYEELEALGAVADPDDTEGDADDNEEYRTLGNFLSEVKGYGGDHQWRGDWYPVSFILDSHFEAYAQELAEDIGAVKEAMEWPCNCIDWERAARELQFDYSSVEIDGDTYWYR
jgi:antirestriction protein